MSKFYSFAGVVIGVNEDGTRFCGGFTPSPKHRLTESRMSDDRSLWLSTSGSLYRNTSPTDFQLVAANISSVEYGELWDE